MNMGDSNGELAVLEKDCWHFKFNTRTNSPVPSALLQHLGSLVRCRGRRPSRSITWALTVTGYYKRCLLPKLKEMKTFWNEKVSSYCCLPVFLCCRWSLCCCSCHPRVHEWRQGGQHAELRNLPLHMKQVLSSRWHSDSVCKHLELHNHSGWGWTSRMGPIKEMKP